MGERSLVSAHCYLGSGTSLLPFPGGSMKSFANALIDALQRIAVALERIAERMGK